VKCVSNLYVLCPYQPPDLLRCVNRGSVIRAPEAKCGHGTAGGIGESQTLLHFERHQVRQISLSGKTLYDAQESAFRTTQAAELINDVENTHLFGAPNFIRRLANSLDTCHADIPFQWVE
jgi:hypothetical protein